MEEGNTSQSVVEYILQLNNRLKRCQDIAITRMKECQLKRKTWYDRDAVERKFVEGDLIDELKQVITKNKDVFSPDPGTTHLMRMDIELISDKPIKTKPYRMSPRQINILRKEIKRLLELGEIEIGQSDYTSPLILVESPNKDPRPCVDYRRLNEITRAEFFPLPNMEEIVEKVSAAPYVTVMDFSKGYFQIPLTRRAQRYAAFVTPFGTYTPKKMMFGTIASPLTDTLKGKIKKEKITWDEKCDKAFEELKAKLVSQPILFAPDFILQTDATERNYSTVERELAEIIFGLKRLKHYLDGQKFIIETDHNPLRYLNKTGSTNPRIILDGVLGARAAGVHYRLFSVWTLVPVRLGKQLSDNSTVDDIASEAADCRLTYTMANCPQSRRFLLGVWTVNSPQSHIVRVYGAGHGKSGVFHSAEWHGGDWSSDGIREAWLWFFIWVESF
ncbi:retrovirus-related Pol polyprotein from transposon 412 [Trichonephila clavipes]|uniref:Retrovirus-related Pol polyprotein from transposon 412 n=1 Tax=Trichonephila clavipes TaxID=2585209 RepID=A0A8X6WD88_TRICX|nr:retrovirus-related Pol polyprotein from transposon 412 [Trichonephila clavipes]